MARKDAMNFGLLMVVQSLNDEYADMLQLYTTNIPILQSNIANIVHDPSQLGHLLSEMEELQGDQRFFSAAEFSALAFTIHKLADEAFELDLLAGHLEGNAYHQNESRQNKTYFKCRIMVVKLERTLYEMQTSVAEVAAKAANIIRTLENQLTELLLVVPQSIKTILQSLQEENALRNQIASLVRRCHNLSTRDASRSVLMQHIHMMQVGFLARVQDTQQRLNAIQGELAQSPAAESFIHINQALRRISEIRSTADSTISIIQSARENVNQLSQFPNQHYQYPAVSAEKFWNHTYRRVLLDLESRNANIVSCFHLHTSHIFF